MIDVPAVPCGSRHTTDCASTLPRQPRLKLQQRDPVQTPQFPIPAIAPTRPPQPPLVNQNLRITAPAAAHLSALPPYRLKSALSMPAAQFSPVRRLSCPLGLIVHCVQVCPLVRTCRTTRTVKLANAPMHDSPPPAAQDCQRRDRLLVPDDSRNDHAPRNASDPIGMRFKEVLGVLDASRCVLIQGA